MEFTIVFYEKSDGTHPALDFINGLDDDMQAKIFREISILRNLGYDMREPYSKSLGDGIFELRAKFGSNISRVLYFFVVGRRIILTNGFIKKTQKTPKKEIDLAKKYRSDYLKNQEV